MNSCIIASSKAARPCSAAAGQTGVGHPGVRFLLVSLLIVSASENTINGTDTLFACKQDGKNTPAPGPSFILIVRLKEECKEKAMTQNTLNGVPAMFEGTVAE